MKNKKIWLITIFALCACGLHALMLRTQFNYYLYTSAFKVLLFILFPVIYFMLTKDGKFKNILSLKGDKKTIRISCIIGFCVFAFIQLAFMVLRPFLDEAMIVGALENNGISSGNFPLVFIYIVLINTALEELFFRGFIFLTLYRMGFRVYAHACSCLLFAFYHVAILNSAVTLGMLIFLIFGLAVAGLIFNYFAMKCRSIIGSLIVHISANLSLNLIVSIHYLFG